MVEVEHVIEIVDYQKGDLRYLVDIDVKGCDWPWLQKEWMKEAKYKAVYIAKYGNTIVGFLIADCSKYPICHLQKVVVHPDYRQLGVATRLLHELMLHTTGSRFTKVVTSIPEIYITPGDPVLSFINKDFKATGCNRNEFVIEGTVMDGVVFEYEL